MPPAVLGDILEGECQPLGHEPKSPHEHYGHHEPKPPREHRLHHAKRPTRRNERVGRAQELESTAESGFSSVVGRTFGSTVEFNDGLGETDGTFATVDTMATGSTMRRKWHEIRGAQMASSAVQDTAFGGFGNVAKALVQGLQVDALTAPDFKNHKKLPLEAVRRVHTLEAKSYLPVELFVDEYRKELIYYLRMCKKDKGSKKRRNVGKAVAKAVGPPKGLRTLTRCLAAAIILLLIPLGLLLLEAWMLTYRPPPPPPPLPQVGTAADAIVPVTLAVATHKIAFRDDSSECRCLLASEPLEGRALVQVTPMVISSSPRAVVAMTLYMTSSADTQCVSGKSFACRDHHGDTESTTIYRWVKTGDGAKDGAAWEAPEGLGIQAAQAADDPNWSFGRRLMLQVDYTWSDEAELRQLNFWSLRRPWSRSGLELKFQQRGAVLSALTLAGNKFVVPKAPTGQSQTFEKRHTFNVSVSTDRAERNLAVKELRIHGFLPSTRELGKFVSVVLYSRYNETNATDPAPGPRLKPVRSWVSTNAAGLARTSPSGLYAPQLPKVLGAGSVLVRPGDIVSVTCAYSGASPALGSGFGRNVLKRPGALDPMLPQMPELCMAMMYITPASAFLVPSISVGESCTTTTG